MEKTVIFLRNSTPEKPELGYGDYVDVKQGETFLFGSHASTCPNPYKTMDGGKLLNWRACYAMLAPCETVFECVDHPKFGKSLLVNGGQELPTINPNRNHDGKYVASEIFVHCGGLNSVNKNWRGSRACFTLHIDYWCNFIDCFSIGEKGKLILNNFLNNQKGV